MRNSRACWARSGDRTRLCLSTTDRERLYRYLPEEGVGSLADCGRWIAAKLASTDPMFFVCVDKKSGRVVGRQALMRITPEHGVIEIGNILWGPEMAKSRLSTEALFLMARYVFDDLRYRRFEWKCDSLNEPSRRAALRFGFEFEGIFRQPDGQGQESRHRLVCNAGSRLASASQCVRAMAGPGKLRRRRSSAAASCRRARRSAVMRL